MEYTFSIQPSGPIPQFSIIRIVLPPEVEINNSNLIENDCRDFTVSGVPTLRGRLPYFNCDVLDVNAIEIERLFNYGSTTDYQTVTFTIPGLQNPRLMR